MKRIIFITVIIIALFFSSGILSAQTKVDSLINVLNTQKLPPAEQLVLYESLCFNILDDLEKVKTYAEKGLVLAEKEKDEAMIAAFNYHLGVYHGTKGNRDRGLVYLEKALVLAQNLQNESDEAIILAGIATLIYIPQSKFDESLKLLMKALAIYEKTDDYDGEHNDVIINILASISTIHFTMHDEERGIYYLEQQKLMAEKLNEPRGMSHAYYTLGYHYEHKGEYDKALEQELKAVEISRSIGFKQVELSAMNVIAKIYSDGLKDYDQAEKYASEALLLAEEYGQLSVITSLRLRLSSIYFKQKRYKECDAQASMVWEMDTVGVWTVRMNAVKNIISANIFLGNKTKASDFFGKYIDLVIQYNDESFHNSLTEIEIK